MSRKKKKENKETTIENYYDLRVDKVDELVEILQSSSKDDKLSEDAPSLIDTPISTSIAECTGEDTPDTRKRNGKEKHFDPYKIDKFSRIPVWLKALFIKWWFAGCVCYFVMMGLSLYFVADDLFLLSGAILGLLVDFIVNPIFRMLESDKKEYNNYMMFPFPVKAFWTLFTNVIYYIIIMYGVTYMYVGIEELIKLITGVQGDIINVGVEPLLFGTFCVAIDMAFIGIKDGIVYGVKKAKRKKAEAAALEEELAQPQPAEEVAVEEKSAEAKALDAITAEVLGSDGKKQD